jgi:hypothetical protein
MQRLATTILARTLKTGYTTITHGSMTQHRYRAFDVQFPAGKREPVNPL